MDLQLTLVKAEKMKPKVKTNRKASSLSYIPLPYCNHLQILTMERRNYEHQEQARSELIQ